MTRAFMVGFVTSVVLCAAPRAEAQAIQALGVFEQPREHTTVNGVAATGGSLNGPGPVIAGGMLFMNSGYAYLGFGAPSNVLLAFGIE